MGFKGAIPSGLMGKGVKTDKEIRRIMADTDSFPVCGRQSPEELVVASLEIWEATRRAIQAVALNRGWPSEEQDDVEGIVRRLDTENPGLELSLGTQFSCALLLRENIQLEFMDQSEMEDCRNSAKAFINLLGALYPEALIQFR